LDGVAAAAEICILDPLAQVEELLELNANLGKPGVGTRPGVHGCAVRVEVVTVATDLHVHLELAVRTPAAIPTASPDAELLITHEVLIAGGESKKRLGTTVLRQAHRHDAQRSFIDEHRRRLNDAGAGVELIFEPWRRFVIHTTQRVAIGRSDHTGRHVSPCTLIAGEPRDCLLRALDPRRADDLQSSEWERDQLSVARPYSTHHRDAKGAKLSPLYLIQRIVRR